MTEVIPGIHWLKIPITNDGLGPAFVNVYLAEGDKGHLIVDTSWNTDESFNAMKKELGKIGTDFKDISQILITHVHPDHYGMAGRIKKLSGCTIAMHHIEKGFIEPRYISMEELLIRTDQMLTKSGVPNKEMASLRDATVGLEKYVIPAMPDIILHDGEDITTGKFNFKVLWTPGHSSGHICLYEPAKKLLISGDHILPTITPNIGIHPQSIDNPLGRYMDSLKDIRKIDIEFTLPGHDKPFTNLKGRIDDIMHHHEERNLEVLSIIADKPLSAYRIAMQVRWGFTGRWEDLPPFHKRAAIFETLAHLDMMAASGHIDILPREGIIYYKQN